MSASPRIPADLGRTLLARWRGRTPEAGAGTEIGPIRLGLRLFEEIHPGTAANVLRFDAEVAGAVDPGRLSAALAELARRHAALRTTFPSDGRDTATVAPEARPDLTVVDLTQADPATARPTALAQADSRAATPMDLAAGPLWRTALWQLPDGTSRLQLLAHHIVADGWSLGVALTELDALYAGRDPGPATPLPAVRTAHDPSDLAAWRDHLAGAQPLSLPTDRPRPATRRFRSAHVGLRVDAELLHGVRQLAEAERATPFMVLLAALHLALSRTAGQQDITVGSPIATRERHRAPGAVGPLATMLALRTDTSAARTARDVLRAVRDTCLDAYGRAHVPFEAVAEQAGQGGGALFDVLFVLQPHLLELRLGDLPVRPLVTAPGTVRHDLELYLWQGEDGITGFLGYDTDLFEADTAELLAERFGTALAAVVAGPDAPVGELDVAGEVEAGRRAGWAVSSTEPEQGLCVQELVEAQVDRSPGAVAVRAVDGVLTYGELEVRANRVAHALRGRGVGPGDLVAVCLPRTLDLVVVLLGVLKSGAGYVPVDPGYPGDRVAFMVEDADASLVLRSLEDVPAVPDAGVAGRPEVLGAPGDVAYVIYTSGSTGRPKGVVIEHRQVAAMLSWAGRVFPGEVLARTLAATSVSFDLSVFEIFAPLTVGGCVVLAPGGALDLITDPSGFTDVTLVNTVPSAARELLLAGALPEAVRWVNLAGEALAPALVRELYAVPGVEAVNNLYGPSEDTTYSTWTVTDAADVRTPIGVPVDGTSAHVLDADLRAVPLGAVGELFLSGAGVTRGYLGRPSLTAERYLPDPFSSDGGRLYRTGDLVRWRADGRLDYLGRADGQVKVRGHRVELGEVEEVLRRHGQVAGALVVAREDASGALGLVAYLVPAEGELDHAALAVHARTWLPQFMVPGTFIELPGFPLLPNGKVDRGALPAVDPNSRKRVVRSPQTPTERLIAGIWRELLDVPEIGAEDDFFALGGHSLLATRLTHRLGEALDADVPLHLVFEHPVLADLAHHLPATGRRLAPIPAVPRTPGPDGTVTLPASSGQKRLWLLCSLDPRANLAYLLNGGARIMGPLDAERLAQALRAVARRHEILRTTLREEDGDIVQVVHPTWQWDPTGEPEGPASESEAPAQDEAKLLDWWRHFTVDLAEGPLFRARVVQRSADEHLLLLSLHHAIADGWTLGLLLDEIAARYRDPSSHELPALQYGDYAHWQSTAPRDDTGLAHWRELLAGAQDLDLPADRPRSARTTHRGAAVPVTLPAETVDRLARTTGTTAFAVVATALTLVLSAASGSRDLTIGIPTSGRTHPDTAGLLGFFTNTLPLRRTLDPVATLGTTLRDTHHALVAAHQYAGTPFEEIVRVAQQPASHGPGRSPLFQVMLALNETPARTLDLPGLRVTRIELPPAETQFELSLHLEHTADAITGHLTYNTDLHAADIIELFPERLAAAVAALADRPESPVGELDVAGAVEAGRRAGWAVSSTEPEQGLCVQELVEAQVDRSPGAVAVRAVDGVLTYGELEVRANRVAHALRGRGVGPGDLVAVCLPRSLDLVVVLLGVLKSGAGYVPVDPGYPDERVAFMVEDAGAAVVLRSMDDLPLADLPLADLQLVDGARPGSVGAPGDVAYVIYTSGSTGRPKGVVIEHRQVAAMLSWAGRVFPGEVLARTLAATSVSFDLSVFEIFAPLTVGGCVVLAPGGALDLISDPSGYADVTLVNTVPSAARELLLAGALPDAVRWVNLAGEALAPALVRELYAVPGLEAVNNLYGPSEDTTYSTWTVTDAADVRTPIGVPVDGTSAQVLDADLRAVPLGAVGELFLSGAGVSRGYLGRPSLTAERYLPDPFSSAGGRLYRTGDLVRWRSDGRLDYLGRADGQVKVRGHRVELGEVEEVLRRHGQVAGALVVAREDASGTLGLVAYLVPAEGELDQAALAVHARTWLPQFMVPGTFIELPGFPLLPNGKVDRSALPAADPNSRKQEGRSPQTPTERLIAGIWRELLDVPEIGAEDDFFALGGHSLLATRLTHRLGEALDADVPLHLVFEHPVLADLAHHLQDSGAKRETIPSLPRTPGPDGTLTLPASLGQERLWVLCRLDAGANLAYHVRGAVHIDGDLDTDAFRTALEHLARRHEVLRTSLREVDGEVCQVVSPTPEVPLTSIDTTDWQSVIEAESRRAFDLTAGPLWHVTLVRTAPQHHVLVMSLHHAIADGWSLDLLLREIAGLYGTEPAGPTALPAVQYADVARWQRAEAPAELAFWRDRLAGAPALDLPTDRPRPAKQTYNGATVALALPDDALAAAARAGGTTEFTVLATALAVVLAKAAGQGDVTLGTPAAGRDHPATADVVGYLVDTLPLRLRLSPDGTLAEALRTAREAVDEIREHQRIPFEELVRAVRPPRDRSRSPLFQVLLAVNGTPPRYELPGLRMQPAPMPIRNTPYDLVVQAEERAGRIAGHLVFNTDLYEPSTAQLIADRLTVVIEALAGRPETVLAELDVAGEVEVARRQEWSTASEHPEQGLCVQELVEAQVDRSPGAVAVRAVDGVLTYGELEVRANRVAHALRGGGVGPGDLVAVCLPRTLDLVVVLLGVLKSGAGYVPVDPGYPGERVAFMVEDADASLVLRSLEDVPAVPDAGVAGRPEVLGAPGDVAYVIYTSGSTGRPKGVVIEHRQVAAMLSWAGRVFPGEVLARTLAATSVSFDLSVFEIFAPLTVGGCVVLAPGGALDLISDPSGFTDVTLVNTVPSAARELLLAGALPDAVRWVNLAGEALAPALVRELYAVPGVEAVNNLYGPSEDTTYSTWTVTDAADVRTPIGVPVDGTSAQVLDADLRAVPLGAVGELFLSGAGVSRGYLGRPSLTAERYLPDPFSSAGGRLYRTGDLVRWRADGRLDYLGRADGQVKVRGHRVELGEVEEVLRRHGQVAGALVVAREDASGALGLVAYLVPAEGELDQAALAVHARCWLPQFMVPGTFIELPGFPLLPNGKVDRGALPAVDPNSRKRAVRSPQTSAERLIAGIWRELLDVPEIGAEDDFFALGGHSLLATRVASRLSAHTGTEVPLDLIFEHPVLSELAGRLPDPASWTAPEAIPRVRRVLGRAAN
ncbi:amino acid adenylation domain-containing protein [Kitasatospora xanthocidica]|uniref:non-ribosomal peptide synthetase n=1 Tax=Kitasatospora xanthocidica TaxID=83382 RepID=UPI0036ED50A9